MDNPDPKILNFMRALGQRESSNNPTVSSPNSRKEGSIGRFQFMPSTFEKESNKYYGGKSLNGTPLNINDDSHQKLVMYAKIQDLKNQGYRPDQIAAIHNMGQKNFIDNGGYSKEQGAKTDWRGVNKLGVKYDTIGHVKAVTDYYKQYEGEGQQTPQQEQPQIQQEQPEQKSFLRKVGDFFTSGTQRFGKTIGEGVTAPENTDLYSQALNDYTKGTNVLTNLINKKEKAGQDTTAIRQALDAHIQSQPKLEDFTGDVINKSNQQILGEAGLFGLEALGGGALQTLGGTATKVGTSALSRIGQGAKIGAGYGALGGGFSGMAEDKSLGGVAIDTAIGAGVGGVLGGGLSAAGVGLEKTGILNKFIPQTEKELAVKNSQDNIVNIYKKSLPLTPLQLAKEEKLLQSKGDNVFTTAVKYGINIGSKDTMSQIDDVSTKFADAADLWKKNENGYFNLSELLKGVKINIDSNIPSASSRKVALNKVTNEIKTLLKEQPVGTVIRDMKGNIKVTADVMEQLRKTGNSWTPFNASDPERIGKSAGYALSDAVRGQVDKDATIDGYRALNKEWSNIIHLKETLQKIEDSGKKFKTPGGFTGSIARKTLSGMLGYHNGGIGGAVLSSMGSDVAAEILSNPQIKTYFDRAVIARYGDKKITPQEITLIENEIKALIQKQGSSLKLPTNTTTSKTDFYASPTGNIGSDINKVQGAEKTLNQEAIDASYSKTLPQNQAMKNIPSTQSINIPNTVAPTETKTSSLSTRPNMQAGFIEAGYKNSGNLTTKILKDLEGKTTVSKQYILDATNRGELKQVERDLIRQVLETEKGSTINVSDFAKKVKAELLPLERKTTKSTGNTDDNPFNRTTDARYENIVLPDEIRGNVKNYNENIYNSPIKTSAGNTHFRNSSLETGNYFGHTRIEDMADNKTRRVIEVQSDLYQKGNLEKEIEIAGNDTKVLRVLGLENEYDTLLEKVIDKKATAQDKNKLQVIRQKINDYRGVNTDNVKKLQQYNDPTAHFRMVREEIKKAAQDGKTKLQFPTGETAMKIEGLVNRSDKWVTLDNELVTGANIKKGDIITFQIHEGGIHPDRRFLITENKGDGTFKAVDSMTAENDSGFYELLSKKGALDDGRMPTLEELVDTGNLDAESQKYLDKLSESLSAKDTVDTNNPIYKFYEKDVQKYLNKFGGKRVVDDKGVSWIEIPITKEQGKAPVEAFGKVKINPLMAGAGLSAGAVIGGKIYNNKK